MEHVIKVPDIGSSTSVDVIEILVKVGDAVQVDTPLVTLESDKASMEIPCPQAGVVKSLSLIHISEQPMLLLAHQKKNLL